MSTLRDQINAAVGAMAYEAARHRHPDRQVAQLAKVEMDNQCD
jgi:hypothetical protein